MMHLRVMAMGIILSAAGLTAANAVEEADHEHALNDNDHVVANQEHPASTRAPFDEFDLLARQITERPHWNNDRLAKEALRPEALILDTDKTPTSIVLRRTAALLSALEHAGVTLEPQRMALDRLAKDPGAMATAPLAEQKRVFAAVSALRRTIAFRNPLLDFDRLVFLTHGKQARGEVHMVDQYLGFNAAIGGGVQILEHPFSDKPSVRSLLAGSQVQNGRLKGRKIDGTGSFISLDLDFDGSSLTFAWTEADHSVPPPGSDWSKQRWSESECRGRGPNYAHYYWRPEGTYHVFRVGIDGTNLQQLTDGPVNDYDPCFMPDGRIAFVSERNAGNQRCGGRPLPSAILHSMAGDGSDLIQLSWHDTNEWQPSVDNNGMLIYTRWDYVDRDSDVAHHLWRCYPDGRDPRALHGNYPKVRESRPWMEMSIRAIPHSNRYVAVAAPHHGQDYGSLILIDLNNPDDRSMSQIRRLTPDVFFPEAESAPGVPMPKGHRSKGEVFGTPWPLSEDFHLCVYDPDGRHYGIWLIDSFGNRELIYQDPAIACLDPIPLRPRPRPAIIPPATTQSVAAHGNAPMDDSGTVMISDVYASELPWPEQTRITALRIVSIFPKPNALADKPRIGSAIQSLTRGVLGTVPVDADGSAHFTVPAGVPFYIQALNSDGVAVQTMRSDTYLHPGERMSCIGCHESRSRTPDTAPTRGARTAFTRAPSKLAPEVEGSYPLSFPRLVQPVLDRSCVQCHATSKGAPSLSAAEGKNFGWSQAFTSLAPYGWAMSGGNGTALKEPQFSVPGKVGAQASKLYALLKAGHHDVHLSAEDMRRITLWLDCNSVFYGDYFDTDKQLTGAVVQPRLGTPPWQDFKKWVR